MENSLQIEVEELASLQFTIDEIKLITGEKYIDTLWIQKGRLKAEAEVRKAILQQAKNGSSPAQKEYAELIKKRENTERRRR